MELEERLEHEKIRSEKIRTQNEKNHVMRMQLLSKLENDYRLYNSGEEERKSFSENGKDYYNAENFHSKKDDQIYRFFTNSARHDPKNLPAQNLVKHKKSSNAFQVMSPTNSNVPSGYELDVVTRPDCKNCGKMIDDSKEGDIPDCFLCYWRNNKEKKFCHNCWGHFKSIIDDYDGKPIQHERALDAAHPKPIIVNRFDDKPYSMNLDHNSIFHPDFSDDLYKINELNDEKISNYAKNYGDLRKQKSKQNNKIATDYPPKKFKKRPLKKDTKIQKIQMREMEEETRDPNVLVQLGSIRKQLQLENLRIDSSN